VILAHRIALDPTIEQSIALSRACGVARFTWNWALGQCERIWQETGKLPKMAELKKTFNATKHVLWPWISESPKDANQQPFAFLRKAYSATSRTSRAPGVEPEKDAWQEDLSVIAKACMTASTSRTTSSR
jgi:transposase